MESSPTGRPTFVALQLPGHIMEVQRRRATYLFLAFLVASIGAIVVTTTNLSPTIFTTYDANVPDGMRVLYVVTTLSEYDVGSRATKKGFDRLRNTLIPVVRESVNSMHRKGYHVDVYIVAHYEMRPERLQFVRDALPLNVGLQVWNDATPLGNKLEAKNNNFTEPITRALARQHRFIIKDKLMHYDFFCNFEDDMYITGDSVEHYVDVTAELYRLRRLAPDRMNANHHSPYKSFFGAMTAEQLMRMMPGFIRVEALLDEAKFGTQEELDPVPITNRPEINPGPCCHLSSDAVSDSRPSSPASDELFLWETNIIALGVRKMPAHSFLDWVVMLRGPLFGSNPHRIISDYWSASNPRGNGARYFPSDTHRPHPKDFKYINNQGGWMATRQQIWEWHAEVCEGSFLPPYHEPFFPLDGLDMRNVEYWSGGLELVTKKHGCNLQRILSMDPDRFSRQLLYHTANNKQRQLHGRRQSFVKINDLLGQLNTVRKDAIEELHRRTTAVSDALHQ